VRVTRRHATRVARWCAAVLGLLALSGPLQARQDWKPIALASFDQVWQIINDQFYDPAFRGLDWKAVKTELRVRAEAAESPDDVRRVITEMIQRLKESHFVLLPSSGAIGQNRQIGPAAVPIDVRLVPAPGGAASGDAVLIWRVERGSTAERDGLRAGQFITQIDGAAVSTLMAKAPAGTQGRDVAIDRYREIVRALHGSAGSMAALDLTDGTSALNVRVTRVVESGQVVTFGNLPPLPVRVDDRAVKTLAGRRVGVIGFNIWMAPIAKPVAEAVDRYRGASGLVIDVRGNPGGLAAMIQGISGHFMSDSTAVLGRMKMRGSELVFHPNPRRSTEDGRTVEPFSGPVAILVDELSGSTSECFAAGVQSLGRARIFGRETMGAALPANTQRLANGDVLMYVVGDFVTSTGLRVEGPGVMPDEVVTLSPAGFRGGHDPDLDAALAWIDRVTAKGQRGGTD